VRVIVPVAAGGANDTTARLFAQKLGELLGQQFYVENLAGAGGNLGIGAAARAAPDGYTLLAAGGNFVINPSLYAKIPYDPERDFAAVSLMCSSPHVLAVHPSVAAGDVNEFIALAKASPGQIELCVGGAGYAGASRRRTVQASIRCGHHSRAVHRRGPGDDGDARRAYVVRGLGAADGRTLCQGWQCACARHDERQALPAVA
jgi:tripartite-type tricarboxylate transporter receptor subunit TctC